MEGKKITKVLELGGKYSALYLDDDQVAIVKVVTLDLPIDELREFVGAKVEAETTKPEKKEKVESKTTDDSSDDEYTWKDLLALDYKGLKKFVKEFELDSNPKDFDEDEEDEVMDFRKEIAAEIGVEIPEDDTSEGKSDDSVQDDDYTWADLKDMDFDELEDVCDEMKLDTDPDDFEKDEEDKFRRAIAKELDLEVPDKKKK